MKEKNCFCKKNKNHFKSWLKHVESPNVKQRWCGRKEEVRVFEPHVFGPVPLHADVTSGGNMDSHIGKLLRSWSSAGRTWDESQTDVTASAAEELKSQWRSGGCFFWVDGWSWSGRTSGDWFIMRVFKYLLFCPSFVLWTTGEEGRPSSHSYIFLLCVPTGCTAEKKKGGPGGVGDASVVAAAPGTWWGFGSASHRICEAFYHINFAA